MNRCDLIVIGGGPGGQKAALEAAGLGYEVVLVERDRLLGGACLHRGTIPSKTLREAALELDRWTQRQFELTGHTDANAFEIGIEHLRARRAGVAGTRAEYLAELLQEQGVRRVRGHATLAGRRGDHFGVVVTEPGGGETEYVGSHVVIATGSSPRELDHVELDHERILDSDSILSLEYLPQSLAIVGGGVIASEYASIFATVGVKVTMVDRYPSALGFLDEDLRSVFDAELTRRGGRFLGRRTLLGVDLHGFTPQLILEGGERIEAEKIMLAAGRIPNSKGLGLETVGVVVGGRGEIVVDEHYQSSVSGIYAVGDVAGPPALASYSMQQGRHAARHACGDPSIKSKQPAIPMGIYTVPELAAVGLTENAAAKAGTPVVVGRANMADLARGQIARLTCGVLKLVCDPQDGRILGVGVAGRDAAELVHVGQMAMSLGATAHDLVETTFNYPTLAEGYRLAALEVARAIAAARARAA